MAQTRSQNKTAAKQNDIHRKKKSRVLADEPPSANETFFGALSQALCAEWLDCIAYCISGIWLVQSSCHIFLKLDSLPIYKGKPYLKLYKEKNRNQIKG